MGDFEEEIGVLDTQKYATEVKLFAKWYVTVLSLCFLSSVSLFLVFFDPMQPAKGWNQLEDD